MQLDGSNESTPGISENFSYPNHRLGLPLLILGLLLAVVITGCGWLYYRHLAAEARRSTQESLSAVADLKAQELSNWMNERLGDAEVARSSAVVGGVVANPNSAEMRRAAIIRIEIFCRVYNYAAVVIADSQGRVQMKYPGNYPLSDASIAEHVKLALHSHKVVVSDLNRERPGDPVYMWMSCPVFARQQADGPADGAILMVIDPTKFLYPTIQTWPTSSKSAETLIVRREGDDVVFLNQLRHSTNSALNLRLPINSEPDLPSVKAIRGVQGIIEGRDYRGVPVLAATRWIPNTPWLMIAKVDQDEIFAPMRQQALDIGVITGLLLLATILGISLIWRQQKLLDARFNEARFRALIEQAPVAVSITRDAKTVYANQKYLRQYGFQSDDELVGRSVASQWAPEIRELILDRARRRLRGEAVPSEYEGVGQRRDGSQFPVHVAAGIVQLSDGPATLAFITDITERKRSRDELIWKTALLEAQVDSTIDAILVVDEHGKRILHNQRYLELFKVPEEIAGDDDHTKMFRHSVGQMKDPRQFKERVAYLYANPDQIGDEEIELADGRVLDRYSSPVRDKSGKYYGRIWTFRDITARKRTEEAVRASEAALKEAQRLAHIGSSMWDARTDKTTWSDELYRIVGWDPVMPAPTHAERAKIYTPESFAVLDPAVKLALTTGEPYDLQLEIVRPDGEHRQVHVCGSCMRDESGAVTGLQGTLQDITDRKRTEQHIRRLNRVYAMLSSINVLIVRERDPQTMFEAACRIAVEKGGFRMCWLGMQDHATQIIKPVASAGVVDGYLDSVNIDLRDMSQSAGPSGRAFLSGEHQICDDIEHDPAMYPWREKALQRGYHSTSAFPLKVAGKVVGTFTLYSAEKEFFDADELELLDELAHDIGFALEINEREAGRLQAEQSLRASERQFASAFEYAAIGKAIVATDGRWLKVNRALCQMLGYTVDELTTKKFQDVTHPEDVVTNVQSLGQLITGEIETYQMEKRYLRKDGGVVWANLSVSLVRDDLGQPVHFISQMQDVTARRSIEEQFRQAQKMEAVGQLAGGVAHDYNNILAASMIQLGMLLAEPDLAPDLRATLESLKRGADRAANLTRQLLVFSRRQAMQMKQVELNALLEDELKMLRRLLGENIELSIQSKKGQAWIEADAGMIEQVIMNLCINARDAMADGGRLTVGVHPFELAPDAALPHVDARPGSFYCLSVRDSGCGMSPETMRRIFEPFFTTKEVGKGTGLGLATVYGIVKQHQGWVEVTSEVGKGTEFRVLLPAAAKVSSSAIFDLGGDFGRGTESVLIVEDEETVREALVNCLRSVGYQVHAANTGPAALRDWKDKMADVDLLITDMIMPGGMNGLELAEAFKAVKPELPVIIMSGYSKDLLKTGIPTERGYVFQSKPCDPATLTALVRKSLSQVPYRPGPPPAKLGR